MAGIRQILQRRKAIDNVRRITRTMEMISTAKYKSYYNRWVAIAEYHNALAQVGYLLVTSKTPIDHSLMRENSSGHSVILAIGSTRGFCGSYNTSLLRLVEMHIERAKNLGKKLDIYAPQRKLVNVMNYRGITPAKVYDDFEEIPSDEQISEMAGDFIDRYMAGKLDYFGVVYTRFHSVSSQQAQTLTLLPLTELIDELATRARAIWPWKLEFEDFYLSPSAKDFIEDLAGMIVRSAIKNCFMNAALSEHLSRMVAMRNATENAEEMIKDLTAEYNHARQSQITGELLDIIGGTGALE